MTPRFAFRLALGLRRLTAAMAAIAVAMTPLSASAQAPRGQTIIRDAEIEQLLRDYSAPIFKAAGIPTGAAKITLLGARGFNAFVADGRKIFINIGALMDSETPNQLIGVIAHESGHIAGGHLARLRQQIANAQILSVAGMLLGAAAIAGAASGGNQVGNAGVGAMGAISGSQEMVMRSLLSYQRTEEQAADRAALRFLDATGQSSIGMIETFKRFADSAIFTSGRVDPYRQSHPMPTERIAALQELARVSPHYNKKDPSALQLRHDLARAKAFGFVERSENVLRRYPPYDMSLPARYARAIATYRNGRTMEAVSQIDGLIAVQPKNAYFHELKGQALLEGGRPQEALASLRRAVALAPSAGAGLIRIMLGHALMATNQPANLDAAIRELTAATQREPESPEAFRYLGMAHGAKGNIGLAEVATAQHYFLLRDWSNAQTQASRAMQKLPKGSPAFLKAQDILEFRPPDPRG